MGHSSRAPPVQGGKSSPSHERRHTGSVRSVLIPTVLTLTLRARETPRLFSNAAHVPCTRAGGGALGVRWPTPAAAAVVCPAEKRRHDVPRPLNGMGSGTDSDLRSPENAEKRANIDKDTLVR